MAGAVAAAGLPGLLAVVGLASVVWLVSLVRRDASIADIFWGLGCVVLAWFYRGPGDVESFRAALVPILVTIWGVRLAAHILMRSLGRGEDPRYAAMRRRWGARFPVVSLFTVFWLQAAVMWIVALPLLQVQAAAAAWSWLDGIGVSLFAVGFVFEAVGDWRLVRFRANPRNVGRVLDRGLWRTTRHPNYFGDATLWWGLGCFALATPGGGWALVGPALMTFLLLRVSGVTLLERRMLETRPGYREYVDRTSAFFPWRPRPPGPEARP